MQHSRGPRWENGSARSSFHSTLNSLEGHLDYQVRTGDARAQPLRERAAEYLLERQAMYRLSDGTIVGEWVARFGYPFRWRYNVLKAADHFRRAALFDGTNPDRRLAEAIEVIRDRRQPDGTWHNEGRPEGQQWFAIDVPDGDPSPWLTLIGTRVLDWWDTDPPR